MLKMVYEESPCQFEEVLTTLTNNDRKLQVGPIFTQQKKVKNSIPDLAITQKSFSVFFENKLSDWFYTEQLIKYMANIGSTENKFLFLMSNFEKNTSNELSDMIKKAYKDGLIIKIITFEDFIGALEKLKKSEFLENMLNDFKIYLDRNDLLPKWEYMLDVVNCAGTMDEIIDMVYICPDTGRAYSHRRGKYFGPYSDKKVCKIYEIDAVVSLGINQKDNNVKWVNCNKCQVSEHNELICKAKNHITKRPNRFEENKSTPLQVFLLSDGYETDFIKNTSGGMQQSKIYFWDIARDVKNAKDLADKLNGKTWDSFR